MLAKFLLTLVASLAIACSDPDARRAIDPADGGAGGQSGGNAGTSGSAAGKAGSNHCGVGHFGVSSRTETGGLGGGSADDTALIVPTGLKVTPRPGINSVFNVIALTLKIGPNGAELYAAIRHDGEGVACNPSFSVELRDKDDLTVGTGVTGLLPWRFYRFKDGSDAIAGCLAPGDVTMVAIPKLSLDVPIEVVDNAVYQSNYWGNLDLDAIDGVGLADVKAVTLGTGATYTGILVNGLDVELSNPTVAVFPFNSVGRPLGVAYGSGSITLRPCGTWNFETSAISEAGVGFDAFPMGGP
jgi:hypothetical protein